MDPVILGELMPSGHPDACPNCNYCFVARNEKICKACVEWGYKW